MHASHDFASFGGILFMFLWFAALVGGVTAAIIFLVAVWRWMRAHEKVAQSLGEIAEILRARESENNQ